MGILNVTPDSFSDGGDFLAAESAITHAQEMVEEGAAIIDVGGESTRPGAPDVTLEEELARVIPVIEVLSVSVDVPISVDTSKPEVMRAAVAAGAGMINDVYALRRPGALETAADLNVPVCLMHMQGEPRTMQDEPSYDDVVTEVASFLAKRIASCQLAGIGKDKIVIDPGFGFGKKLEHNLSLLKQLKQLCELGVPLLAGMSRKSMIAAVLDQPVDDRLFGSVALATLATWQGASILRVHDVRETVDAVRMAEAVVNAV
ncbi:dihydropteroate synthase [Candidatus Reidiella endopervernicosa]|nr:dihydropteroate synthase [Candidatus Reidiella endopervernicosa]